MTKTAWVGSLAAAMCVGFLIGVTAARSKKAEVGSRPRGETIETGKPGSKDTQAYVTSLEKFRKALVEREREVEHLKSELAEVREQLPLPLGPEQEKRKKEQEERRKQYERRRVLYEKTNELRKKILQRRDRALREEGFQELAALVQSDDTEAMMAGLTTIGRLWGFEFDKDRFKPDVLKALKHEDAEIRKAAFDSLQALCSNEEQLDAAISMLRDPSHEIRLAAVCRCGWVGGTERIEEVASAMRALLEGEDKSVQKKVLDELWRHHFGYDYGAEIEDIVIELSRDPEMRDAAWAWLSRRGTMSAGLARRLVEMHNEGQSAYYTVRAMQRNLSNEARPIALGLCLQVLRESIEPWERQQVLGTLRMIGDRSVVPQLQEIAVGPDAESIQDQLAQTIEYLQTRANQPK